eukprot:GHVR01150980.1.p1 GENE.GHVR01150980.1~~GHVR01150980.1.p1  ORF type:complete len:168 (-),score=18.71 GHVR01150980.1:898-1401(-)
MKLHYSTEGAANNRFRKIKAVANAVGIKIEEIPHETNSDLSLLSPIDTLPLLETTEGTFFSSNTIVRFLAASAKYQLYGGENLHHRALVDQWLDISACEFEGAVSAVTILKDGKEVDVSALTTDVHKFLTFVENHLKERKFLVGEELTIADISLASSLSVVLSAMFG